MKTVFLFFTIFCVFIFGEEPKAGEKQIRIYPNDLKNREFSDAECPRFESEKTDSLLDIGAVFSGSKMGSSAQEKTDSSGRLGIHNIQEQIQIYKERALFADREAQRLMTQDFLAYRRYLIMREKNEKMVETLQKKLQSLQADE